MLLGLDAEFVALSPAEKVWLSRLGIINLILICASFYEPDSYFVLNLTFTTVVLVGNP
jgi:hypothetical protein